MRPRSILTLALLLLLVLGCSEGADPTAPDADDGFRSSDIAAHSYGERLEFVRKLAEWHPGIPRDPAADTMTLWTGFGIMTAWQQRTGRDAFDFWSLTNAALTALPHRLALELRAGHGDCATMPTIRSLSEEERPVLVEMCRAWLLYFASHDAAGRPRQDRERMQALLWEAHTRSLDGIVRLYEGRFSADPDVAHDELRYWEGWAAFVRELSRVDYPTDSPTCGSMFELFMAPCSPIEGPGCRVEDFGYTRRIFTLRLLAEEVDVAGLVEWVNRLLGG